MKNLSAQTKSFIVLLSLAVFGAYLCFMLWLSLVGSPNNISDYGNQYFRYGQSSPAGQTAAASPAPPVDTSGWKTYIDPKYNFSFEYKPDWKVLPAKTQNGFTVLQIDPGPKYYNIKIYISPKEFYAFAGLPTTQETIGGQPAQNVNNDLYGIFANNLYYTFDVGLSMSLAPDFDALVHSVKFGN